MPLETGKQREKQCRLRMAQAAACVERSESNPGKGAVGDLMVFLRRYYTTHTHAYTHRRIPAHLFEKKISHCKERKEEKSQSKTSWNRREKVFEICWEV